MPPNYFQVANFEIFPKFSNMKMFGHEELVNALSLIGLNTDILNKEDSRKESEVIFCLTLNRGKGFVIESEIIKNSLCNDIETDINKALSSLTIMKWLSDTIEEDPKDLTIDREKIQIKVLDIFPGSEKVVVQLKYLDFPDNPAEVNSLIKVIQGLLQNLPSVSKVSVEEDQEMKVDNGVLRMKVRVGPKKLFRKNKKEIKKFLEDFIENMRETTAREEPDIKAKLLENGITPVSVNRLLDNLFAPDKIVIDLQPTETCHVETMRLKNMPLWPCDQMRLLDVSNRDRFTITEILRKNLEAGIWEDVATKLEPLNDDILFCDLQKEISAKFSHASPYGQILRLYTEKSGTIGGLLKCLDNCRTDEDIISVISPSKLDEMIDAIQKLKESHFLQWLEKYQNIRNIPRSFVASYEDFKATAARSRNTRCVLGENISEWNEDMQSVLQEGDQIWMWRQGMLAAYAHVGVYVGDDSMIHVSNQGLSGVIRKDHVKDVIQNSKCFIIKQDPGKLTAKSGIPKVIQK